jgi:PII-like signaling protein
MDLYHKKKIEIVTDAAALNDVAQLIKRCGASGYTVIKGVAGQGSRGVRVSGDIFGVFENVMVIVVAEKSMAERILSEVMQVLEARPRMVLVSDVEVLRDDHF